MTDVLPCFAPDYVAEPAPILPEVDTETVFGTVADFDASPAPFDTDTDTDTPPPETLDGIVTGSPAGDVLTLFEFFEPPVLQTVRLPYSREQIVDAAFTYYREHGFPTPTVARHQALQEINMLAAADSSTLLGSTVGYHIPDTYHPHRFSTPVVGKRTVHEVFNRDAYLRHAVHMLLDNNNRITDRSLASSLAITRNAQLPAQFRPGAALYLYRRYAHDDAVVFDPSTGYGGRIVGWLASTCAEYIGVDPEPRTCRGNQLMLDELADGRPARLFCLPAEDVPHDVVRGVADLAMSSPPYFSKEMYSTDDTQSWVRYRTPDAWRSGFLVPYLALCHAALRRGGTAAINVADVIVKTDRVPLVAWTRSAGEHVGLRYVRTDLLPMARVPTHADRVQMPRFESIVVFEKP